MTLIEYDYTANNLIASNNQPTVCFDARATTFDAAFTDTDRRAAAARLVPKEQRSSARLMS